MAQSNGQILLLEECDLQKIVFSEEEIEDYAQHIGIDIEHDRDLFWLAEAGLREPLPKGWVPAEAVGEGVFYFNKITRESVWDHPCDKDYRLKVQEILNNRVVQPLSLVFRQNGDGVTAEAWNLAGTRVATTQVKNAKDLRIAELKEILLAQVALPEGTVPRFVHGAALLGHSDDSRSLLELTQTA